MNVMINSMYMAPHSIQNIKHSERDNHYHINDTLLEFELQRLMIVNMVAMILNTMSIEHHKN